MSDNAFAQMIAQFHAASPEAQMEAALGWDEDDLRLCERMQDPIARTFASCLRVLREEAGKRPFVALRSWLTRALVNSEPMALAQLDRDEGRAPRWPSSLPDLDQQAGGFYGVTVLAGETGCGKSTWACASAFEAALAGWYVIYLNAELDDGTLRWFIRRYFGPLEDEKKAALAAIRFVHIRPGIALSNFAKRAALSVPTWAERMLIVADSINTICEMGQGEEGQETYFQELRRWLLWAMESRRLSNGRISHLVVSELNAKGETKGRKADYVADMVLRVQRGESDGYVKVKVTKGRYSGTHDFGGLLLDHRTGRLRGAATPQAAQGEML